MRWLTCMDNRSQGGHRLCGPCPIRFTTINSDAAPPLPGNQSIAQAVESADTALGEKEALSNGIVPDKGHVYRPPMWERTS
jgi:hypothetical protein